MATADSALLGLLVGLVPTAASIAVAVRQTRETRKLATLNSDLGSRAERLKSDLDVERQERKALLDRRLNAEDLLTRYREPLAAAAFDLQSRCYNIAGRGFYERFGVGHERFRDAQMTTLFRFAQYFGWTEILRREIQFLSFPEAEDTRRVARLQSEIARRLASSDDAEPLMIWTEEQRAIGERMIVLEQDRAYCKGYAQFCDDYDASFAGLFKERLLDDLHDGASAPRLRDMQSLLCDLVEALDKDQGRYDKKSLGRL